MLVSFRGGWFDDMGSWSRNFCRSGAATGVRLYLHFFVIAQFGAAFFAFASIRNKRM